MKLKVSEIKTRMEKVLQAKNYSDDDITFLIEMYLGGELRGHTSHGLASFPGFVKQDFSSLPKPEVLLETASLFMIDAKSNPGALVGKQAADEAIKRAKQEAIGAALVKNMDSWLRPGGVAEYIAEQGFVAIVTNDGGGASVAPPGGFQPMLGTNPIAYALPTEDGVLAVDLATSKKAWGQVRLANKHGTNLPEDTFYNSKGEVTEDPSDAYSVKSFGEYKGFALGFLVEVICGSLLGNEMMKVPQVGNSFGKKQKLRGGLIIVIDPDHTSSLEGFKRLTSEAIQDINDSQELQAQKVRLPGAHAAELRHDRIEKDEIEVPDQTWEEIVTLEQKQ